VRIVSTLLFCLLAFGASATPGTAPVGLWFTPDHGGVVRIGPCGADLCGTIVGLTPSPEGKLPNDVSGETQCHLGLFRNLHLGDDGKWHGTVRNPEDGQVYNAEVWVPDGNLRLRGYVGVPLLGSTQTWQPFTGAVQPDCRFH